jgi:hypothetical protein
MNSRIEPGELIDVSSTWILRLLDKNGRLKQRVEVHNLVTTQGKNFLLDVMFHNTTALNPWYLILWTGAYVPVIGDTYAVPGYTELNTEVDEATRAEYVETASSGGIMTNAASRAVYTFGSAATINGLALVAGSSTKANTAASGAILFCSARLTASVVPAADDIINVLGTITAV